jgi:hypothetical protein
LFPELAFVVELELLLLDAVVLDFPPPPPVMTLIGLPLIVEKNEK